MPKHRIDDNLIIRTEKLCKSFGTVNAVLNLDFQVRKGELFGIVGPDGAGKTTTMRMLSGILVPTSGQAWVDGVSVVDDPEGLKEHIAYMPQRFGLYADLTVMENLVFYADLFRVRKKERPARIERLLGFSRLSPFKDRLAGALSGGMKQKLGLACALIHSPRLILLDEPTNGVDPVSRRDFWMILNDLLKEGISILVTTAYLDEAERMHRLALMHHGTIIEMGEPKVLKQRVQGIMIELASSDLNESRAALENIHGILDVNIFGDVLHVRIKDDSQRTAIQKILSENGIELVSMKIIEPSIEDAFMSLIPKKTEKSFTGVQV